MVEKEDGVKFHKIVMDRLNVLQDEGLQETHVEFSWL
jgi:hypothetical protein